MRELSSLANELMWSTSNFSRNSQSCILVIHANSVSTCNRQLHVLIQQLTLHSQVPLSLLCRMSWQWWHHQESPHSPYPGQSDIVLKNNTYITSPIPLFYAIKMNSNFIHSKKELFYIFNLAIYIYYFILVQIQQA